MIDRGVQIAQFQAGRRILEAPLREGRPGLARGGRRRWRRAPTDVRPTPGHRQRTGPRSAGARRWRRRSPQSVCQRDAERLGRGFRREAEESLLSSSIRCPCRLGAPRPWRPRSDDRAAPPSRRRPAPAKRAHRGCARQPDAPSSPRSGPSPPREGDVGIDAARQVFAKRAEVDAGQCRLCVEIVTLPGEGRVTTAELRGA